MQPPKQQQVKAGESSTRSEGEPKENQEEGAFTTVTTKKGDTSGAI